MDGFDTPAGADRMNGSGLLVLSLEEYAAMTGAEAPGPGQTFLDYLLESW